MEILSIENLGPINDYVYDLETEAGIFLAGSVEEYVSDEVKDSVPIEGLILKNTDSCYVQFQVDRKKYDNEVDYMKEHFRLAIECAEQVTQTFRDPIDLEFEKFMYPFFLFTKKRYAYQEWEEPEAPNPNLQFKGIQVVRRDSCPYVKEVSIEIFDILMRQRNTDKAVEYARKSIDRLLQGEVDPMKLVISKSLNATYKVNGEDIEWQKPENSHIIIKHPHVHLAKKLKEIDPINCPKPPDRVPFIFIENYNSDMQYEKAEHPDYLEDKKPDALYYFEHQLKKPIEMIFDLMIPDSSVIYKNSGAFRQAIINDKRSKTRAINASRGQIEIDSFFKRKVSEKNKAEKKKEDSTEGLEQIKQDIKRKTSNKKKSGKTGKTQPTLMDFMSSKKKKKEDTKSNTLPEVREIEE